MKKYINNRLDYLDNIKWCLAIIVIMHHSFDYFQNTYPKYKSSFDIVLGIDQSYFMDLFFFISAFFIVPSLIKKGKSAFNKDKIIRLGGALLITYCLVEPLNDVVKYWGVNSIITSYLGYLLSPDRWSTIKSLQWGDFMGVTWFCWTLLLLSLIWSLFFRNKVNENQATNLEIPSYLQIIIFCILMVPLNCIAVMFENVFGSNFLGFRLIGMFPSYIAAFMIGIKAYQNNWLDKINLRYGLFGLILFSFGFYSIVFSHFIASSISNDESFRILRTFCAVGMILFLLYIFKKYFNHSNKVTKALARASFPAYVIQFVFLNVFFKFIAPGLNWNPWFITLFVGALAVICSFTVGMILYRLPFFKRIF